MSRAACGKEYDDLRALAVWAAAFKTTVTGGLLDEGPVRCEDAEFVVLGINENCPRDVALPDVGMPSSEPGHACDLP
jgi:hypothetical protein